jgi:hypothetical protein
MKQNTISLQTLRFSYLSHVTNYYEERKLTNTRSSNALTAEAH